MELNVTETRHQIRELAARALARVADPLAAARSIDALASSLGLGLEEPFISIKGIASQADAIPDPDQLRYWDPVVAEEKRRERIGFLEDFEEQILEICAEILIWADDSQPGS